MAKAKPELIMAATLNARALAAVSRFAGIDEDSPYLEGVHVEIRPRDVVYVATDGHKLLAMCESKLVDSDADNDMTGAFTIPTAQCRFFKIGKKEPSAGVLLFGDEDRLTLQRGDVSVSFSPLQGGKFVGRWLDWRHVIPSGPLAQGIGQFNGSYLADFQKFADDMCGGVFPFLAHNGSAGPGVLRFQMVDAVGIIMPLRSDDLRMKAMPDWAEIRQAAE